jgi:RNA polymerase sigma-70 factor, ECF subfamily
MTPSPDPRDAFVALLSANHRRLLGYVTALVGNRHDAADVVQRASVTLWRKFDTFAPGSDFLAWACTVAFYEARNFQRVSARQRARFSDALVETLAAERLPDLDHTDARQSALERCLEKLDDSGRALVEAAYSDQGSLSDLAARLGRAPQTLYNRLHLLRRALADCVTTRLQSEGAAP